MEPDDDDDEDLRSRSDARRERKAAESALAALAESLVGLPAKQRAALELPDLLDDAVEEATRMPNPRARARQLRVVRRELREGDHRAIEERLRVLLTPSYGSAASPEVEAWIERLGDDDGVEAFVQEHPGADRQRLRTLARNFRKAEAGKRRRKARRALVAAVQEHVPEA